MKKIFSIIAVIVMSFACAFSYATEPTATADASNSEWLSTNMNNSTTEITQPQGENVGGETDGAPLPINNYEYALMAAGIAIAGYAALRLRKQNA